MNAGVRPEVILISHTRGRGLLYGQMMMLPSPPLTLVLSELKAGGVVMPWPSGTCLCGIRILVPDHVYEELHNRDLPTSWPGLFRALDDSWRTCGVPPPVEALPPLQTETTRVKL